jgi:hypothetical protein
MLPAKFFDVVDSVENGSDAARTFVDRTYALDNPGRFIDGVEAAKQAVYKILKTERFRYPVYSTDYGIELEGLIGTDSEYVCIELERRIVEALSVDGRIGGVSGFSFDVSKSMWGGSVVHAVFNVGLADGTDFRVRDLTFRFDGGEVYVQQHDI